MNINDIKAKTSDILKTDDLDRLLQYKVEISVDLSNAHNLIYEAKTDKAVTEAKGKINILYSLTTICDAKITEKQSRVKREESYQKRLDYNFHKTAKELLTKDHYTLIRDFALLPLKEMREKVKNISKF